MQVPGEPRPTACALERAHILKRLFRLAVGPAGGQLIEMENQLKIRPSFTNKLAPK